MLLWKVAERLRAVRAIVEEAFAQIQVVMDENLYTAVQILNLAIPNAEEGDIPALRRDIRLALSNIDSAYAQLKDVLRDIDDARKILAEMLSES